MVVARAYGQQVRWVIQNDYGNAPDVAYHLAVRAFHQAGVVLDAVRA